MPGRRTLISLGFRCDVAFQLRMHSGNNTSHFFDWLATPAGAISQIFDRRFDVFHPDHLVQRSENNKDCVADRKTGVVFWHQFPLHQGALIAPHLLFYKPFAEKFAHLGRRFIKTVHEQPVILVRAVITPEQAAKIERSFFRLCPGADARFLYIVDANGGWTTASGHAREMPRTERSLGDPTEWSRLLRDEGLIDEPYRLSTAAILGNDHDDYNLSPQNRFTADELRAAIATNPGNADLHVELACLSIAADDLPTAAAHWSEALKLDPSQQGWSTESIVVNWRLGMLPTADAAAAATWVQPYSLQAYELMRLLIAAGQFSRARLGAISLMQDRPMDAELSFLKARACAGMGRHAEAEFAVDHAIALQPNQWRYHLLRAELLAKGPRMAAALTASQTAAELHDSDATRKVYDELRRRAGATANLLASGLSLTEPPWRAIGQAETADSELPPRRGNAPVRRHRLAAATTYATFSVFGCQVDALEPDARYTLTAWVWIPAGFRGSEVSLCFTGRPSLAITRACLHVRDAWQPISVSAHATSGGILSPTLLILGDADDEVHSTEWHLRAGAALPDRHAVAG
jgi:tetratricopeptide (TPR) repeat protein